MNEINGWDNKPNGWESLNKNIYNINSLNKQNINTKHEYDAIFVLAGGIDNNGLVFPWVKRRLDVAREIYNNQPSKIICMGGGTYHKPPILNSRHYVIHESTSCSEYLIQSGIDSKNIYREWSSYDTIANGFFAFMNFIIPLDLKKIVVITSNFHMNRSKAIFDWMNKIFNKDTKIFYYSVTDQDLNNKIISIRRERENNSLKSLNNNVISKINTLPELHKWFYEDHKAYCSNIELIRTNDSSEQERKSY